MRERERLIYTQSDCHCAELKWNFVNNFQISWNFVLPSKHTLKQHKKKHKKYVSIICHALKKI